MPSPANDPSPSRHPGSHARGYANGSPNGHRPPGAPGDRMAPPAPKPNGLLTFLAPFLGAFAGVVVLALVGVGGYFGWQAWQHHDASGGKDKNLLLNVGIWQPGKNTAATLDGTDKPDIGWWTRTFDLPKEEPVIDYLKKQGITVTRIEPAHYTATKDDATLTYDVYAEVPAQLLTLQKTAWSPADPDLQRFRNVLVLNQGLPAGQEWNTQQPTVAAEAGTRLNFAWKVKWDKTYSLVETDRLPLSEGVFTQQEVAQFQTESANAEMQLRGQIQQIDARVQADTNAKLAQVPPDPPKPQMLSSKFGGSGSGEPTKSGERIGGGAVAGAAGGAAFGAIAGDAGLGAGIGAGVGLLGGLIYDGVSKSNDRKKHEREVAAENEERLDNWHDQLRDLKKQRSDIQQQALAERDHDLDDLATRIQSNNGKPDGFVAAQPAPATYSDAPQVQPVPAAQPMAQPTADQPSGPIVTAPSMSTSADPKDAAMEKKLVGYWSSGRHDYQFTEDGVCHMLGGTTQNRWTIRNGIYSEIQNEGPVYTYTIVSLTDNKFVYRSRGAAQTTFTLKRLTPQEIQDGKKYWQ